MIFIFLSLCYFLEKLSLILRFLYLSKVCFGVIFFVELGFEKNESFEFLY